MEQQVVFIYLCKRVCVCNNNNKEKEAADLRVGGHGHGGSKEVNRDSLKGRK